MIRKVLMILGLAFATATVPLQTKTADAYVPKIARARPVAGVHHAVVSPGSGFHRSLVHRVFVHHGYGWHRSYGWHRGWGWHRGYGWHRGWWGWRGGWWARPGWWGWHRGWGWRWGWPRWWWHAGWGYRGYGYCWGWPYCY